MRHEVLTLMAEARAHLKGGREGNGQAPVFPRCGRVHSKAPKAVTLPLHSLPCPWPRPRGAGYAPHLLRRKPKGD
jgi:hypothetical protein